MAQIRYSIVINVVMIAIMATFFSCQSKHKNTQQLPSVENAPIGEAYDVILKYTENGKTIAVLKAPLILDYTHLDFGYNEFPEGVILDVIDKEDNVSVIIADYAISYDKTRLIDMIGHVDIKTADSTHLKAKQLYWDQNINWIFTDQPYQSKLSNGAINNGDGFDANQDFTTLNSRTNIGVQILDN